jgi:transcription elongation factor GreA
MGPPPDGGLAAGGERSPQGRTHVSLSLTKEPEVDTLDDALLVTAAGYEQLEQEFLELTANGRRRMSERVRDARLDGDIADNPTLLELLEEQLQLESRIASLSGKLAAAQVAAPPADGCAAVGSAVRVRHLDSGDIAEYELVGTIESGVGHRRVSIGAPVGRALLGHRSGAVVEVATPSGRLALEVLSVRYTDFVKEAA